jgi:ribosomal protein S18 acetylase RimI-like enzyme
MEIREVRPDDCAAAGRVTQAAWREFERPADPAWAEYFERLADAAGRTARALVLVAVEDGEVVGTATVELEATIEPDGALEPGHAGFRMLAVDPAWRGRGIGRALVEECLERARAAGKTTATLHTADEMVAALRLYRSLGFERDPGADLEAAPGVWLRAYRLALAAPRSTGS